MLGVKLVGIRTSLGAETMVHSGSWGNCILMIIGGRSVPVFLVILDFQVRMLLPFHLFVSQAGASASVVHIRCWFSKGSKTMAPLTVRSIKVCFVSGDDFVG